jgi:hypothetical protein
VRAWVTSVLSCDSSSLRSGEGAVGKRASPAPYRTNELDTPGPDCSASPGSSVGGTDQLAQPPTVPESALGLRAIPEPERPRRRPTTDPLIRRLGDGGWRRLDRRVPDLRVRSERLGAGGGTLVSTLLSATRHGCRFRPTPLAGFSLIGANAGRCGRGKW